MHNKKLYFGLLFSLPITLLMTTTAEAATRTWDGSVDADWSTAGNWVENSAPVDGDDLVFPADADNKSNNNNLSSSNEYASITLNGEGYDLAGNTILIADSGSLVNNGNNEVTATLLMPESSTLTLNESFTISANGDNPHIYGQITGPGGIAKYGDTQLHLYNDSNDFGGMLIIYEGSIGVHAANALGSITGNTQTINGTSVNFHFANVTQNEVEEEFTITGAGNVGAGALRSLSGHVILNGDIFLSNAETIIIRAELFSSMTFNGVLSGTEVILNVGGSSGLVTFNGDNTYTGTTNVVSLLEVNGEQPNSNIYMSGNLSRLSGSGTIGGLSFNGFVSLATVVPTGRMTVIGNIVGANSARFTFTVSSNSVATGLNVIGTISLAGSILDVSTDGVITGTNSYTMIDNDSSEAILGTFADLTQGATFEADGQSFSASYTGSTGNDFVVTSVDTSSAVYRFLHKTLKIHFYTNSVEERNFVQSNLSSIWEFEGTSYSAFASEANGTTPVYRFLHKTLKTHFYTANESERTFVQSSLSSIWEYEGVAYYVYPDSGIEGTDTVHRFLHKTLKIHFYTASESEKDFVQNNLSSIWQYEGQAYYSL